ncbi:hypothetical protein Lwal_2104 [Legionella waltersii]|uniref:Uncharacterized protein n=1 Tax=Legionella waltersii TaxID=66969 RepID=A0A0W1A4W0_9GAMM|nr:hypothetical protein Lwal_2104 [Legionella waltersii]SNV14085.1 Uncharacterised protein [Legionella waltersii]
MLVTAGSESVRLLTCAARFLLCCLNQLPVTAGSELSRARQQADTELSTFTNDAAKAAPFGEAPDHRLLTLREEIRWGTIIGVDSSAVRERIKYFTQSCLNKRTNGIFVRLLF